MARRYFAGWMRPDLIFYSLPIGRGFRKDVTTLNGITEKAIKERKSMILDKVNSTSNEEDNIKKARLSFLDILLTEQIKNPELVTDLYVRNETNTFILAGYDTSACCLSFTLFLIGLHQEVQNNIHNELDMVMAGNEIDYQEIRDLKYLDCVIKESLRMYPPVPLIERAIEEGGLDLGEYHIPEGVAIIVNIYNMHRDKSVFSNPDVFMPERFMEDSGRPYTYVPFSSGPRNCIGQKFAYIEMKTLLANVLKRFKIKSITQAEEISIKFAVVLDTKDPLKIKFEER